MNQGLRRQVVANRRKFLAEIDAVPLEWRRGYVPDLSGPTIWHRTEKFETYPAHARRRAVEMATACQRAHFNLNISNADLIDLANKEADRCARIANSVHEVEHAAAGCASIAGKYGIELTETPKGGAVGAVARAACPLWWRRKLRRVVANELEKAAIGFGFVHRKKSAYVSRQGFIRWQQQQARNRRIMEQTSLANTETGEIRTLAELVETSVANPLLRRGELMTRIRGFEEIAEREGHASVFITVTCPSRMHARLSQTGDENPTYDGTTPRQAQNYLTGLWAKVRAALARLKVRFYGFRVAEPHHDGCPHWHMLFFVERAIQGALDQVGLLVSTIKKYALADSPDEPGAQKHRVAVVEMEPGKGTASSYIAKYIAKGIGNLPEGDLFDAPAGEETKPRAWASTWHIRQFQQIGGPSVGLWRELRRIPPENLPLTNVPDKLVLAWYAAHRHDETLACWRAFCEALGGVFVKRKDCPLQLKKRDMPGFTRYREPRPPRPAGVFFFSEQGEIELESVRDEWRQARVPRELSDRAVVRGMIQSQGRRHADI